MSLFSTRLRQLRAESGESQEDIARYVGVTRSNYSAYERDVAVPPYGKIVLLAKKFGVTVEYLMGHTNNMKKEVLKEGNFPDIMDQLARISEELMNETVGVLMDGKLMTEEEKRKLLPMINSCMDMARFMIQNNQK